MPCKSESHSSVLRGSVLTNRSQVHIASLLICPERAQPLNTLQVIQLHSIPNRFEIIGTFSTEFGNSPVAQPPSLVFLLSLGRAAVLHEVRDEVDGQREDDGRVLLRRNRVEGLKRNGE